MSFCSNCGEKNGDGIKFCSNCGNSTMPISVLNDIRKNGNLDAVPMQAISQGHCITAMPPIAAQAVPIMQASASTANKTEAKSGIIFILLALILPQISVLISVLQRFAGLRSWEWGMLPNFIIWDAPRIVGVVFATIAFTKLKKYLEAK